MGTQANRNLRAGTGGVLKYGFVGPALVFLIAFNIFPLLYSIGLSFTDARLSGGQVSFVGGRNYAEVFAEGRYADSLRTTAVFRHSSSRDRRGRLFSLAVQVCL